MEIVERFWDNLVGRIGGPLSFRLLLQPAMAIFFAVRDGMSDARHRQPAYFWALFAGKSPCAALLGEGLAAVARVILLGLIMDFIYQFFVLRHIYPLEGIAVAMTLAFIPYLLVRGPANRIMRLILRRRGEVDFERRRASGMRM